MWFAALVARSHTRTVFPLPSLYVCGWYGVYEDEEFIRGQAVCSKQISASSTHLRACMHACRGAVALTRQRLVWRSYVHQMIRCMLTAVHNSGPETFIRVLCGSCVRETRYCSVIGSAFLKAQSEFIDSSNAAFPESEMIHFRKPVDHPLMLPQPNVCSFSPSFHPHVKSLCGECGGAGPATWMSQSQQEPLTTAN